MTTHDSTSWNVHRETLRSFAHEVDGIAYIGGRGVRLDGMLEQTYVDEAHQLGNDLAECLAQLPPGLAQQVLDGMKGPLGSAASARHAMHSSVPEAQVPDVDVTIHAEPLEIELDDSEAKRKRRRRDDDAAAALDGHRDDSTGEIDAVATGA